MAYVTISIGGRAYRMACDDGQEEHLAGLGEEVDARIDQLRAAFGEIGDQRLSIMAAITIADELSEAPAAHPRAGAGGGDPARRPQAAALQRRSSRRAGQLAGSVVAAAERLEKLARELGPSPSSGVGMG